MTTWIIQYALCGAWHNYQADDNTNVEFFQKSHAQRVATDVRTATQLPIRIADSHGNYHEIKY